MYKLIIADDDEIVLKGLCVGLDWKALSVELVTGCENGKTALQAVHTHQPDILLTDVRMPFMDGIELISAAKNYSPSISAIIISAHDEFSFVHRALRQGAEDYLLKPIDLSALEATIRKIVYEKDRKKALEMKIGRVEYLEKEKQRDDRSRKLAEALLTQETLSGEEQNPLTLEQKGVAIACILRIPRENNEDIERFISERSDIEADLIKVMDRLVLILSAPDRILLGEQLLALKDRITEVCNTVFENGCIVDSVNDIRNSYEEALEVDRYFFINQGKNDLYLNDFTPMQAELDYESIITRIVENTILGNRDGVIECRKAYESAIRSHGVRAQRVFTYSLSRIFAEIENRSAQLGIQPTDLTENGADLLSRILSQDTCGKSLDILEEALLNIADAIFMEKDSSAQRSILRSFEYIEHNYRNPDLRISDVCTDVGLSQSYFSILFKRKARKSFTDYLTEFRMEKAKRLLESTNYRAYEVGHEVGFNNPTYFSSAFKKFTGVPPSMYAKKAKK